MQFNKIEELIEDIRQGKMVILVDDEDRENEGDIVLAADHVSSEAINFMATEARGLICLSLSAPQIEKLQLPLMVRDDQNFSPNKTAFTVSIEASFGVSTGISAADRAHTIRVASNPAAKASDINMPGHIFPIKAQHGGVLKRAGHTEGSVDLAKLAGLNQAAVICEVMNHDGTMARVPDLLKFAKKHHMKIGTIVDLIEYRLAHESLVEEVFQTELPEEYGANYKVRVFKSKVDNTEHLVIQKGEIKESEPTLVRVQLDSYVREVFTGLRTANSVYMQSLQMFEESGSGVLLLLRGFNKSNNLVGEIKALTAQQSLDGHTKSNMDDRDYGIGAQIIRALGIKQIRLVSNKPEKRVGLKAYNLEIVEIVPLLNGSIEVKDSSETTGGIHVQ